MRKWKYDTEHSAKRCGHSYCSDCKTRRGRNIGNRLIRHGMKLSLNRVKRGEIDE